MDTTDQMPLFDMDERKDVDPAIEQNCVTLFALASIRGVGFATIKGLCDDFRGDLKEVFRKDEGTLMRALYDARTPNPSAVLAAIKSDARSLIAEGRKQWTRTKAQGVSLLFREDPRYPPALMDLVSPPSWIFVQGDVGLLHSPFVVGFVGTRAPSSEGLVTARRAASYLSQINAVILSGLAEGIDNVGHQTAILYGVPTIAVLGHGINKIFPVSTAKTRDDMLAFGGAIVSEYLPNDEYSRDKFVARNRIQAALSRAVCFIEARKQSGTAHTLRFAKQLNRPVFGVVIEGYRGVPEEELLHVLAAQGDPVFALAAEQDTLALHQFLHKVFTTDPTPPTHDAPRMFRNVAREVQRLAEQYRASKSDMQWLIRELRKISDPTEAPATEPTDAH